MKAYVCIYLCFIASALCLKCSTRKGCKGSENQKIPTKAIDYWVIVGDLQESCSTCICREVKKYTNSCIEAVDEYNEKGMKKSSLGNRLKGISIDTAHDVIDEEVELPKKKAISIECEDAPSPIFDEESGTFSFPALKYVHFYYVEKESFCCQRQMSKEKLNSLCEVKYDDRCHARIVEKGDSSKLCGVNFPIAQRTRSLKNNNNKKKAS
ncbi:uncharacterized protein LOC120342642 [Styela clava]